jgi:ribose/xylose/arabinose/galactoside ABC-type transport system permease subunit
MLAQALPQPERPSRRPILSHETVLAGLLVAEIGLFSIVGQNFASWDSLTLVLRQASDIGLLAVLLTPVILMGGIDLSVGSLMGLSAVLLGKLWRDAGLPIGAAAGLVVLAGAAAGGLNALFITKLRIPPLIVTLGSFSLFRGLAEGLTRSTDNFTGFPSAFLAFGQKDFARHVPYAFPIFAWTALAVWLLVHRTAIGRSFFAIGFSPEGARHAGVPVERRLALAYVLSGAAAALAAVVYVATNGQAKADAALGYELVGITAVVLGGTSIFGGRGSVHGTLLGLFSLVVLKIGLQLSEMPTELADILTGVLLLVAIGTNQVLARLRASRKGATP